MSYERMSCPVKLLPLIIVDLTSPVVVCRRKQATITVTARGHPRPCVTWLVGRNRKPISATAGDKYFRCENSGDGRHSLVVSSVSGVLDDGVWVVASNDVGEDKCFIDVKTYRVLRSLDSLGDDPFYSVYSLLRGCRLRRRMCDPDDVIAGDVGTLTSHRTAYKSLPRDVDSERSRRTGSDQSTRRNDRISSSLVRVDSGLADESVAVSPLSSVFTDNIHDELSVPPAPAVKVDSLSTEQHLAMNAHSATFDSDFSYVVADSETGRIATGGDKENGVKSSRKKKKKKKSAKQKGLNRSRTTETSARDDDERRPGKDKRTAEWQLVNESLWDFNGVKLWRYCAQILGFSSKLGANDAETAGATAAARPVVRESDGAVEKGWYGGGGDSALGDSVTSTDDVSDPTSRHRGYRGDDDDDDVITDVVSEYQVADVARYFDSLQTQYQHQSECSREDNEFRHHDEGRQRSELKVIPSYRTCQRSHSADSERHLQAPYDVPVSRGTHGDCRYRQISRCWYDVAVARAAVANGSRTQQQRVSSSSSSQSPGNVQSHQLNSLLQPQLAQVSWRRKSTPVYDAAGRQTGSRMTSSESQLHRGDVTRFAAEIGDVDGRGTTLNVVDVSSERRRSRCSARRDLAHLRQRRPTSSVSVSVPRRCRSESRTGRRSLSREMRLIRTTTTTETTTVTLHHYQHQQQQQYDEILSHTQRCLATAVLASSPNTSQTDSHESNSVDTDSDDAGTLVAEPIEVFAPWSDEVTDVTDGVTDVTDGVEQRDDVAVTSESCDITATSENCDDVAITVTSKSITHLMTESSNGDVTTDVAIDVDDRDLRSTREASQPSSATVECYEDATLHVSSGETPIPEENNQRHAALNLEAYTILGDNATAEEYSEVLCHVVHDQRYNEDKVEGEILEDNSCLLVDDDVQEHRDVTAGDDTLPPVSSTATTCETEEDLKATADDIRPGNDDNDNGDDYYVCEEKRTLPITTDVDTVCDVDSLSNDILTGDVQTTSEEQLRERVCQWKTVNVHYIDNSSIEKVDEAPVVVRTDSPASTVQTASDDATLTEDILTEVNDMSNIDHVDNEYRHDTDPSYVATCSQIHDQSLIEDKQKCEMSEDRSCLLVKDIVLDHQEFDGGDITRPPMTQITDNDVDLVHDDLDEENGVEPLTADDDTVCDVNHLSYDVWTSDVQTTSEEQLRQPVFQLETDDVQCGNNRFAENAVEAPDVLRTEATSDVSALQTSNDDAALTEDVLTTVDARSNTEHVDSVCTQDVDPSYVATCPEINQQQSLIEDKDEGEILEDNSCLLVNDDVEEYRDVTASDDTRKTEEDLKATADDVDPGEDDDDDDNDNNDDYDVCDEKRTLHMTIADETVCDVNDIWMSDIQTTSEEQIRERGCQLKTVNVYYSDNRFTEKVDEATVVVRTDSPASTLQTASDEATLTEDILTAVYDMSNKVHVDNEYRHDADPSYVATCPQIHDQSLIEDKQKCEMSEDRSCLLVKDLVLDHQELDGGDITRPQVNDITEEDTQTTVDSVPPRDDDVDEQKRAKQLTADGDTAYSVDRLRYDILTSDIHSEEQLQQLETDNVQYSNNRSAENAVEAPDVVRTEADTAVSALQAASDDAALTEDVLTAVNDISNIDHVDSEYRQDTDPSDVGTCPQIHDQSLTDDKEKCEMSEESSCLLVNDFVINHRELDAGDITRLPMNDMTEEDPQMTAGDGRPEDDDVVEEKKAESPTTDDRVDRLLNDILTGDVQTTSEEQLRDLRCQLKTDCSDNRFAENVDVRIEAEGPISTLQTASDDAALTESVLATVDVTSNTERIDGDYTQDTDPSRVHRHQSDVDENQSFVSEEHQLKTVRSVVDDVMAVEELEDITDAVQRRCCSDVAISTHVSCDRVDTESGQTDVMSTTFMSPSSINRGGNDVILLPVSERHATSLEFWQVEEMNDLREVFQARDDSRPPLVERTDVEPSVQTYHDSTSLTEGADNAVSAAVDSLPARDVAPTASNDMTSDSSTYSQNGTLQQHTDQHLCIHLYDDSHLSLSTEASGHAELYVDQTKGDEPHEISLIDGGGIPDAAALFHSAFLRDSRPTVQSQRLIPSDGHSNTEIFKQCSTTRTVSLTSDDSLAVVESLASDVEVTPVTDESLERPVSERDKAEVDARLVMHDYGEMWSVFREIPLWVEVLRAEVVERHNKDPRITRLLARYPSLRPGTWVWTTAPLVSDLQRAGRPADEPESRPTTSEHLGVSDCWSYAVQPVMERCTLVVTSSHDVIE